MDASAVSPARLDALEETAAELASAGGAEIASALTRSLAVRYKTAASSSSPARDPVTDVDLRVEEALREILRDRFPDHAILGEELEAVGPESAEFVWALDPIDGTTNFVHAYPLFACSVGVLHLGRPIAGAVWCASSHELRPGTFHGRTGGELRFEGRALRKREPNAAVLSRIFGDPGRLEARADGVGRTTGSAAVECAFVAAGILDWALFQAPRVWDVAGGIALVLAAGRPVQIERGGWLPFDGFTAPDDDPRDPATLRRWQESVRLGAG